MRSEQSRETLTPAWAPWTKVFCIWPAEKFHHHVLECKHFSTCCGGQQILTMDLCTQSHSRGPSSFWGPQMDFFPFHPILPPPKPTYRFPRGNDRRRHLPPGCWIQIVKHKQTFYESRSRTEWPKNVFRLVLASLDWGDYVDFLNVPL